MHTELRELLRRAEGESQFVLAVNIDIRGFSSFFADSSQAAAFLSYAYTRILDEYFPNHSFFKPTGDGLLLVAKVDRDTVADAVQEVIRAAVGLDHDFATICEDDTLINYPTPPNVGIGLARGTATRLSQGDKTLDYSGRPLNLASRLMDLARPHGVVFDESFLAGIEKETQKDAFGKSDVYIKGIADSRSMPIYHSSSVSIPQTNRRPFGSRTFVQRERSIKRSTAATRHRFVHYLEKEPFDLESVELTVSFPAKDARGNRDPNMYSALTYRPIEVREDSPGRWQALFDYDKINAALQNNGVKTTWDVQMRIRYQVAAEPPSPGASQDGTGAVPADVAMEDSQLQETIG